MFAHLALSDDNIRFIRNSANYGMTAINKAVETAKHNQPECFHTAETLKDRKFFNNPGCKIQNSGYIL